MKINIIKRAVYKFKHIKRRIVYRCDYFKCSYLTRDHTFSNSPFPATAYIAYGDSGWPLMSFGLKSG